MFAATTTSIGHIYNLLKAVSAVASKVSLHIFTEGIKISVDTDIHTCQAHLFLMPDLFSSYSYEFEEDYIQVQVSLMALTDCLKMFVQGRGEDDTASFCRFHYQGEGEPFIVYFKEGQTLTTKCELATFEIDEQEHHSIELDKDNLVQHVITKGAILFDAIKELETMKTDVVTLQAQSLVSPHYLLISKGDAGQTQISFPNEKQVMETFDIRGGEHRNVIVRNSYSFRLMAMSLDALALASKVSIRCDENGTMSVQSMCPVDTSRQSFIDFRFQPAEV